MKQIFNWTIGSFFRTIGRTIAILVMGGLLFYILSSAGIDFGRLNLFYTNVKADTWSGRLLNNITCDNNSCDTILSAPTYYGFTETPAQNNRITIFHQYRFNLTIPSTANYVEFSVYAITQYQRLNTTFNVSAYLNTGAGQTWCTSFQETGTTGIYTLKCPIYGGATQINGVDITYIWEEPDTLVLGIIKSGISPLVNLSDNTDAIIIEQQQQTNDAISNQTEIISDTNTTTDTSSTIDFFNDSNSTSAEGSLQGIVSAPLSIINNLITDGSSSPLCFTLNNKQSCIPDGSIIWSNQYSSDWFSGGSKNAFISLFNLVVGGFLVYKMLMSLYRMVDDMLNPTSSRIEVMRL